MDNIASESLSSDKTTLKKSRKQTRTRKILKGKPEKSHSPKKLWPLGDDKDGLSGTLVAWGRERGLYFLGIFCLLMFALLFSLQAYLAFRSYKMLHQITTKKHIPETLYKIYFDGYDWALDLDKVDLRANTSLFIH